jgi:hypothetical protein
MMLNEMTTRCLPLPSPSRMRYVEARLEADADAVLREIAYVLALTQRVNHEMHCAATETAAAGS